jgi:hypothetical protein
LPPSSTIAYFIALSNLHFATCSAPVSGNSSCKIVRGNPAAPICGEVGYIILPQHLAAGAVRAEL